MSTASGKVFSTVELLDIILQNIPDANAAQLTRLLRINSTWKDLIDQRFAILRFLRPVKSQKWLIWDRPGPEFLYIREIINPLSPRVDWTEELCAPLLKMHPILNGRIIPESTKAPWTQPDLSKVEIKQDSGLRDGPRRGLGVGFKFRYRLDDITIANLPRGGEWESMFCTQPPISDVRLHFHVDGTDAEKNRFACSEPEAEWQRNSEGLTLGELRDCIDQQLWKNIIDEDELSKKARKRLKREGIPPRKEKMVLLGLDLVFFDVLIVG